MNLGQLSFYPVEGSSAHRTVWSNPCVHLGLANQLSLWIGVEKAAVWRSRQECADREFPFQTECELHTWKSPANLRPLICCSKTVRVSGVFQSCVLLHFLLPFVSAVELESCPGFYSLSLRLQCLPWQASHLFRNLFSSCVTWVQMPPLDVLYTNSTINSYFMTPSPVHDEPGVPPGSPWWQWCAAVHQNQPFKIKFTPVYTPIKSRQSANFPIVMPALSKNVFYYFLASQIQSIFFLFWFVFLWLLVNLLSFQSV